MSLFISLLWLLVFILSVRAQCTALATVIKPHFSDRQSLPLPLSPFLSPFFALSIPDTGTWCFPCFFLWPARTLWLAPCLQPSSPPLSLSPSVSRGLVRNVRSKSAIRKGERDRVVLAGLDSLEMVADDDINLSASFLCWLWARATAWEKSVLLPSWNRIWDLREIVMD